MSILGALQGTSGYSVDQSQSVGYNYGVNSANSWQNAENWAHGQDSSSSWTNAYGQSESQTYGREASAMDILRAAEANAEQRDMWEAQARYNSIEAEKNRQYQTHMSNTAYQRAVQDLLKAGLNPILAVGNMGASTPSGATASSGLATSHKATSYAEQRSHSYNTNQSRSSSYGYKNSYGYNKGQSASYGYNYGANASQAYGIAQTNNNIRELTQSGIAAMSTNALADIFSGGSASSKAARGNRYAGAEWIMNKLGIPTGGQREGGNSSSGRSGKY